MKLDGIFETQATFYYPSLLKKKVIGTEVAPCILIHDGDKTFVEQTDDEDKADFWSVFIRVDMQGMDVNPIDCVLDVPTKQEALDFEKFLRILLGLEVRK